MMYIMCTERGYQYNRKISRKFLWNTKKNATRK